MNGGGGALNVFAIMNLWLCDFKQELVIEKKLWPPDSLLHLVSLEFAKSVHMSRILLRARPSVILSGMLLTTCTLLMHMESTHVGIAELLLIDVSWPSEKLPCEIGQNLYRPLARVDDCLFRDPDTARICPYEESA